MLETKGRRLVDKAAREKRETGERRWGQSRNWTDTREGSPLRFSDGVYERWQRGKSCLDL